MEKGKVIHILRNPHGWDEETIREARLVAADMLEDVSGNPNLMDLLKNKDGSPYVIFSKRNKQCQD